MVRTQQPPVLAFIHAARKIGLVAVPAAYRFTAEELQYVIDNSDAVLVVVDAEHAAKVEAVRDQLPKVREVVVFGGAPFDGARAWDDVLAAGADDEPEAARRRRRRHDDLHVGHHRASRRARCARRPTRRSSVALLAGAPAPAGQRGAHHDRSAVPLGPAGLGVAQPHASAARSC